MLSETIHRSQTFLGCVYCFFLRPRSCEIHQLTCWAFTDWFKPFFWTSIWLCWSDWPERQLELSPSAGGVVLFIWFLVLLLMFVPTTVFACWDCFWHGCRYFFKWLLLNGSCYGVDCPFRSLCARTLLFSMCPEILKLNGDVSWFTIIQMRYSCTFLGWRRSNSQDRGVPRWKLQIWILPPSIDLPTWQPSAEDRTSLKKWYRFHPNRWKIVQNRSRSSVCFIRWLIGQNRDA